MIDIKQNINNYQIMKKILVTGGSGFIGSNIVKYYSENGYKVLNVDIATPKLSKYKSQWIKIDTTHLTELKTVISDFQPEYILHLAARTDLNGQSIEAYDTNTLGTENLIKIAQNIDSVKRIIFFSSMLVCKLGYTPKNSRDYTPTTFYGESKAEMEQIIHRYNHHYKWAIVRPTSIWGPGFGVPYHNFFDMVIKHSYFHIGYKKSCTKTYGYIGNSIYQIDSILNAKDNDIHEKVFYIGDYEPINIRIWANEIAKQLNYKIKSVPLFIIKCAAFAGDILKCFNISFPMTSFRLKNMTTDNIINLYKTKEIAPNLPFTRIEGIRRTLEWIKSL